MAGRKKLPQAVLLIILGLLALSCVLPFLLLIMSSVTDEATLSVNGYSLFPAKFSTDAYLYLSSAGSKILRSYMMTILTTGVGTAVNLVLTMNMAYLISKKDLPGRSFISFFIFFTMLFNGGMVPSYIVWTNLMKVRDSFWGLLLPNLLMSAYNVILMRTYFTTNIPEEIIEAARIDSCSEIGILLRIALPLSKPMIATVSLFSGLAYWNDWMNGLYYLVRNTKLYTIQNVLNTMMNNAQFLQTTQNTSMFNQLNLSVPTAAIRMAIAVIAVIPVLIIYPFVQKFFVKGIVVGGVKG